MQDFDKCVNFLVGVLKRERRTYRAFVEPTIPETHRRRIFGIGRLMKTRRLDEGEFAVLISDQWQGKGLGTVLLKQLVQIGKREGLTRITADIIPDNIRMQPRA